MVNVKICGLTRMEDVLFAVRSGAWAIGFIFYRASPRYVRPEWVAETLAYLRTQNLLPPCQVGVFVDSPPAEVAAIVRMTGINRVQLHGQESLEWIKELSSYGIIKAFRLQDPKQLDHIESYSPYVTAFLIDSFTPGVYGGTGKTFDWNHLKNFHPSKPLIVSGGLDAGNIQALLREFRPFAVDLASGVESQAGIKDHGKIADFFAALGEKYGSRA